MNYNIIAYCAFIVLMILIIVYAGNYFYRNGRVFILELYNGNEIITNAINKILLITYYLFNIGYAFIKLRSWEKLINMEYVISTVSFKMGLLIFILAMTHYFNLYIIYSMSKSKLFYSPIKQFNYE